MKIFGRRTSNLGEVEMEMCITVVWNPSICQTNTSQVYIFLSISEAPTVRASAAMVSEQEGAVFECGVINNLPNRGGDDLVTNSIFVGSLSDAKRRASFTFSCQSGESLINDLSAAYLLLRALPGLEFHLFQK